MLLKKTGKIDISIGDNDWVNGIFEKAGISVKRIGFHKREELEGTKIRGLIRDKKKWEKRVPEYLISLIDNSE
jgi:nicotinamide mononucleotide adenylyltransferase